MRDQPITCCRYDFAVVVPLLWILVHAGAEHLNSVRCPCKEAPCVFDASEGMRPKLSLGLSLGPSAKNREFLARAWRLIYSTFEHENTGMDTALLDDLYSPRRPLATQEEGEALLPTPCRGCHSRQPEHAWLPDYVMRALQDGSRGLFSWRILSSSYTYQLSPGCNCLTTCCMKCWRFIFVISRLGKFEVNASARDPFSFPFESIDV